MQQATGNLGVLRRRCCLQERWEEQDAEYYGHSRAAGTNGAAHEGPSASGEDLEINAWSVSSTKVSCTFIACCESERCMQAL